MDYLGIAADLKQALAFYGDAGGKGDPARMQEQAVAVLLEKLDVLAAMFHGFDVDAYFTADKMCIRDRLLPAPCIFTRCAVS